MASEGPGNHSSPREAQTRLTIRVTPTPDAQTHEWTLTCRPPGGSHPAPEAACAALREAGDPFKPVPPDVMCTQIYGGPQTAVIEGTWRGEHVRATYNRINGCEIQRWEAIKPVLQPREASPGSSSTR